MNIICVFLIEIYFDFILVRAGLKLETFTELTGSANVFNFVALFSARDRFYVLKLQTFYTMQRSRRRSPSGEEDFADIGLIANKINNTFIVILSLFIVLFYSYNR